MILEFSPRDIQPAWIDVGTGDAVGDELEDVTLAEVFDVETEDVYDIDEVVVWEGEVLVVLVIVVDVDVTDVELVDVELTVLDVVDVGVVDVEVVDIEVVDIEVEEARYDAMIIDSCKDEEEVEVVGTVMDVNVEGLDVVEDRELVDEEEEPLQGTESQPGAYKEEL
ncbi:MAG: hypothetical protein Q9208_006209 [Pyrenodesmia sp. 3 TL-2023]